MSIRDIVLARVVDAGGRLTVRSALNPILWLCLIVSAPAMVVLPFAGKAGGIVTALAVSPVAAAIFGFFYLLLFDRDKLQSEDYQLRKRSLELIEQKGEKPTLATDVEVITDPDRPLLGSDEEIRS